jgi:hypothetical protein
MKLLENKFKCYSNVKKICRINPKYEVAEHLTYRENEKAAFSGAVIMHKMLSFIKVIKNKF